MKVWTDSEEQLLRKLYGTTKMPTARIAEILGVSIKQLQCKAHRLGVKRGFVPNKRLTPEQENWLRRNYPHVSADVCAVILNICRRRVIDAASRLGIRKSPEYMAETQRRAAAAAYQSHMRNNTFPQKGVYNTNLQKGKDTQFKPKHKK